MIRPFGVKFGNTQKWGNVQPMNDDSVTYDPFYQALRNYWIAQGYTLPSDEAIYNQLAADTLSVIDHDAMWVWANNSENTAYTNWHSPGTFTNSILGGVTFTANEGVEGNGVNGVVLTGYNAFINGSAYEAESACVYVYQTKATVPNSDQAFGNFDAPGGAVNLNIDPSPFGFINDSNVVTGTAPSVVGLHMINIKDGRKKLYHNGVAYTDVSAGAGVKVLPNLEVPFMARKRASGYDAYGTFKFPIGGICRGLTDAEALSMYNGINTFLSAL